jgi:hypothetical protein
MLTHDRRANRVDVHVVEHDLVHPAADRLLVRTHVDRRRPPDSGKRRRNLQRNINVRERRDLLRLPVVEQLEVVDCEPDDCVSLLVGDDGVYLDEVDFGLKVDWGVCACGRALLGANHFHDSMTFR